MVTLSKCETCYFCDKKVKIMDSVQLISFIGDSIGSDCFIPKHVTHRQDYYICNSIKSLIGGNETIKEYGCVYHSDYIDNKRRLNELKIMRL